MQPITVTLQLERAGDSITGSAIDAAGARREFSGWLGLISTVDALLSTASAPTREVASDARIA